jgi:biotin carboxylase
MRNPPKGYVTKGPKLMSRKDLLGALRVLISVTLTGYLLATFIRTETAELMQDKTMLRDFLAAHNISPVRYKKVSSEADLEGWDRFPAIVKPADSQGQLGVFRADSMREVKAGLESAPCFSMGKTVIVEDFLDGPEVSANVFVIDSWVVFCAISDRLVVEGYPGGIPKGHVLPSGRCLGQTLREANALVERCIQAFAIENGPVYFQMKLAAQGPRIIEVTPRLDGCHIWRLIKSACSIDLLDASFALLAGGTPARLHAKLDMDHYHLGFFLSPPGDVFDKARYDVPGAASFVEYYYQDGETVRPVNGLMEEVGYYVERVN